MGALAESARRRWQAHVLRTDRHAVEHCGDAAMVAVTRALDLSPGLIESCEGTLDIFKSTRHLGDVVVGLIEGDALLVKPVVVTSGNVPPAFLIFALDTSQDPPIVLGPPVTNELSYGHALEEGTPEDEWDDEPWDLAHFVSATNDY